MKKTNTKTTDMKEVFPLNHIALYSKGWYESSSDFWSDIRKCLTCDGYAGELFTEWECCGAILAQIDALKLAPERTGLLTFYNEIQENNCWKYGYVTRNSPMARSKEDRESYPEYNQNEAVVRFCLSVLHRLNREQIHLTKPDFVNCLPMSRRIKQDDILMFDN